MNQDKTPVQNGLITEDNKLHLLEISPEDLKSNIVDFFNGNTDEGVFPKSRESDVDVISDIFVSLAREIIKEKFRKAIFQGIREWDPHSDNVEVFKKLCIIAKRMRISRVLPYLYDYIDFNFQRYGQQHSDFNYRLLNIIFDLRPSKIIQKSIIQKKIIIPDFTGICLVQAATIPDSTKTFRKYLPTAIQTFRRFPEKVDIRGAIRTSLISMGEGQWKSNCKKIIFSNINIIDDLFVAFTLSDLQPIIREVDRKTVEFTIVWPTQDRTLISTELTDCSIKQMREIRKTNFQYGIRGKQLKIIKNEYGRPIEAYFTKDYDYSSSQPSSQKKLEVS